MKELLGSEVVVSVPARADFVHVLRSVTASVAARVDFPYDAIDDLRLAVDEACAQLLPVGSEGSALTLRMTRRRRASSWWQRSVREELSGRPPGPKTLSLGD